MRLERLAFTRLLAAVTKVVEARNTIPILSTVRLVADGDVLTATATDLDIEVSGSMQADGDFAACVDAKLLLGIVSKLAGEHVDIEQDGASITLKSGRSRFALQSLPIGDFPAFTADGFTAEFTTDLAALFAPVQFAISTEETRFYLNGIFLHTRNKRLTAVATDGHRLSRHVSDLTVDVPSVIVPRKMVGLVPKGIVNVQLSSTKFRVTQGDTVITSKLIDGTFPDYERIMPTGNDKLVVFDTDHMAKAAARVSVISSERGRAVKLAVASDQITLDVTSPDTGSAAEDIIVSYGGEPMEIGFNSLYLAEVVGVFPPGDVTLALFDAGSPALLTSKSAPGLTVVIMPMRV